MVFLFKPPLIVLNWFDRALKLRLPIFFTIFNVEPSTTLLMAHRFLILLLLLFGNLAGVRAQKIFYKTYLPKNDSTYITDIKQTSDGGYVFVGGKGYYYDSTSTYVEEFGNNNYGFIVKTNSNGDTIWSKSLSAGKNGLIFFNGVDQLVNGNFISISTCYLPNSNLTGQVLLCEFDINGDTLWTKCVGNLNSYWANSICHTIDGGFIIGSTMGNFNFGTNVGDAEPTSDFQLMKFSATNQLDWDFHSTFYTFSGPVGDPLGMGLKDVQQSPDGSFVFSTCPGRNQLFYYNIGVGKVDSNGKLLWFSNPTDLDSSSVSYSKASYGRSLGMVIDGNSTYFASYNDTAVYITKFNSSGKILWTDNFVDNYNSQGKVAYSNDNLLGKFLCKTSDNGLGLLYGDYFVRIDSLGNMLWNKKVPTKSICLGTNDNGFLLGGMTSNGLSLIKLDSNGVSCFSSSDTTIKFVKTGFKNSVTTIQNNVLTDNAITISHGTVYLQPLQYNIQTQCESATGIAELPNSVGAFQLYPNPTNTFSKLNYTIVSESTVSISMIDILGHETLLLPQMKVIASNYSLDIPTANLSNGIYFVRLVVNGDEIQSKKLMVVH